MIKLLGSCYTSISDTPVNYRVVIINKVDMMQMDNEIRAIKIIETAIAIFIFMLHIH